MKLENGKEYWVSQVSEDTARKRRSARRYVGAGSSGEWVFESSRGYGVWKYAVPIPEKKLRQWDKDTCPPIVPAWAIRQKVLHTPDLVTGINYAGVTLNGKTITWLDLFEFYEHTLDGKTWLPCGVEGDE